MAVSNIGLGREPLRDGAVWQGSMTVGGDVHLTADSNGLMSSKGKLRLVVDLNSLDEHKRGSGRLEYI